MKKIRVYTFAILLALSVCAVTACQRGGSGNNQSAGQTRSSAEDREDRASARESTGVIGGLLDDVESGADELMDGSAGGSHNADEADK